MTIVVGRPRPSQVDMPTDAELRKTLSGDDDAAAAGEAEGGGGSGGGSLIVRAERIYSAVARMLQEGVAESKG